jgi:hypothetical protein
MRGSRQLVTAAKSRVICKLRARTDGGSERNADGQQRHHGGKWRRGGPISNTTAIVDMATGIAAPENMEAETLQAPDSAPTPQKDEWPNGSGGLPRNGGRAGTGTYK